MWILDLNNPLKMIYLETEAALLKRLHTVRKGVLGAFILSRHDNNGASPEFWIHMNGELAYVHFFDDQSGANAGYQASGMVPAECPDVVMFVQIDGSEGSGEAFEMLKVTICHVNDSYQAATEFFHSPVMPPFINWTSL